MAKTRRTHPSLDDGNGSRRERYQPIVNTAAPPPRVTKDVSSPLSTASVATRSKKSAASTSLIPTLPPMQRDVEPLKLPKDLNSPRGEYMDIGEKDNDYNNNNDDNDDDDSKDQDYKGIDDDDEDNDDDDLDDNVDVDFSFYKR